MPSGKPRRHKGSNRGRPSNEQLYQRIAYLEELLVGSVMGEGDSGKEGPFC